MKQPSLIFLLALLTIANLGITSSADTFTTKSKVNGTLGQYTSSTSLQEELTELQILNLEAMQAIQREDWKLASSKLKMAFAKDAESPETFLGFAKFHYARKEYAYCENAIVKGLEKAPNNAELLYEHSRILVLKGDLPQATAQASLAVQNKDSTWMHHYWLSHLFTLNGQSDAAKDELVSAIKSLGEFIKELKKAINEYEQQERVISSYTATEEVPVGTIGGGYKQIEVVKYNTERMVAPESWTEQLKSLEAKKVELEQKLAAF